MTNLRSFLLLLVCLSSFATGSAIASENTKRGKVVGSESHSMPSWFKQSFLEIADDVDEANAEGKHVMLFFDLDGCPYCDHMLEESFSTDPVSSYIQSNFDVIAVNIEGNHEIAFNEETVVTEKKLAGLLKVRGTPVLMFLNENNEVIARVDGYRAPERLQKALEFVATRSYRSTSLPEYLHTQLDRNAYELRDNPLFSEQTDLSSIEGPLMLILEDGSCYDCNEFHDSILADDRVAPELENFTIVRLDADSSEPIQGFDGNAVTPAELAREFETIYRPGVLLFEDGKLLRRHNSLAYPQHFMESLRYVGRGIHKTENYGSYRRQLREEILSSGENIDWSRSRASK